ncbi:MAG: GDSL-type esterase/lipase family protein [Planctomycetota bacterium]
MPHRPFDDSNTRRSQPPITNRLLSRFLPPVLALTFVCAPWCMRSTNGQELRISPETDPILIDDIKGQNTAISQSEPEHLPEAIAKWEKDVRQLETLDLSQTPVADAILFVGSSSIRRWTSIATDMAPYRTIRRGYGGAKYSDVAHYARRLITPHAYRALVLFVGNDVSGDEKDHTLDQVEGWVMEIIRHAREHRPQAPILIVEVTVTPKRFDAWPKISTLNSRLREITLREPNTHFVPTSENFLNTDKSPRVELFVDDRLHLNESGYALWASLIRRRLDEVFRLPGVGN